ncbi:unnamed protein product [Larinioides sclopetarius]|uniref:Protein MRVI1 n=1 Tax=Larinioides sclopetarius TaxID=280406 RepID=A0AAV1ZE17_9ARAC
MGSCVSHCSRQDVVHQQTGRVITDSQKSIEITSGSALLPKSLAGIGPDGKDLSEEDNDSRDKTVLSSVKLLVPESTEVRDQINAEIRALREQLVRSQVLFTYLLKNTSENAKSPDGKKELCTLFEGGTLGDAMFQCKSFDGQVLARLYNRSNRSSSSYTSHRSTPMHCGYTSLSCPTLPIDYPAVTKSTQTEPLSGATFFIDHTDTDRVLSAQSTNSLNKGIFSPPVTPCGTIPETFLITDICEIHREPEDHTYPRHRTNSFLSAVKEGNPKLIDAQLENEDVEMKQIQSELCKVDQKNEMSHALSDHQSSNYTSFASSSVLKSFDMESKGFPDEINKLETAPPESKPLNEKSGYTMSGVGILEKAKSESDAKSIDDRNGSNKEKLKYSQRSMRRGSGAGSPNSQLTIPRYPAFDFSEQEDVHSMFPSPSEPEANRNIKTEDFPGILKLDKTADSDAAQNTLNLKDTNQKKRNSSKSKTLMPEHMENSETESTKGSFECEAPDMPPSCEATSIPVPDIAFPSLPNTFLAKLGVHKDSPLPVEAFDEHDLESKFIALSLAFKTDRATLVKRLELHKRQRDMAEKNVENEFQSMRDHLCALNLKATSSDVRDLISKIQNHLDIAQQAAARVSGRSETYGAVQQEERVSRAFEVLVLHVDHLKRLFDKEHKELEDTRKMLTDTRGFRKDVTSDVISEDQKKYSKTFGLPVGSIKSEPKQNSLSTYPMASIVGLSSNSLSPQTTKSPTRMSTTGTTTRRCSLPSASPMAPNNLQSPETVSDESTPPVSSFLQKSFCRKKERNIWTRKLSAVTDEKEQSEEESEVPSFEIKKVENVDPPEISTEHFMLRAFLQQVEQKTNEFCDHFDNQFDGLTDLPDETDSADEICENIQTKILSYVQNSAVGKYLYSPVIQELWQQNNTSTLARYFCSTILAFVALCFLLSLILPCIGINLSLDFAKDIYDTLISFIIFCYPHQSSI